MRKKRKRRTQRCINTEPSLLTPMSGLDNIHRGNNDSFAAAVAGRSHHLCASAVRRQRQQALSRGNTLLRHVLGCGFKWIFSVIRNEKNRAHTTPHNVAAVLFQYTEVPPPVLWPSSWSPRKTEDLQHLSDQDQRDATILQTQGDQICKAVIYSVNEEGILYLKFDILFVFHL